MTPTKIAIQYANNCIDGKVIACKPIKEACERFLLFMGKYDYREEAVDRVINFIQKLKHSTGSHAGKPFILQPWQTWVVANIFGFYKPDGHRLINTALLLMSRKNGKSAFAAALSLYCLIADGEQGAEVDFLANNAKQAGISFDMSKNFVSSIDPKGKHFRRMRSQILFPKTKSQINVFASDSDHLDGFNSSMFVLDEIHAMKDSRLYDVMVSSQGMRTNPLALLISTCGFNQHGFLYPFQKTCSEVLSGAKEDDSIFAAIYTLDEEDQWEDENVWIKSNPNLGVTVKKEYIKRQVQQAKLNPSLEVGVRIKNLNQWCNSASVWIPYNHIYSSQKAVDLTNDFPYQTLCYMGVDLSAVSDLTALAIMIPYEGKYYFKVNYYLPETALREGTNATLYQNWYNQGYLNITNGNVTDYDAVTNDIMKYNNHLLIDKIAYDSWNSTQWAIDATAKGLPLEPFQQSLGSFNRPTKEFERLIRMGKVVIDHNPITSWCFDNVELKYDHCDNVKPIKGADPAMKIDGVVAMIEALGIYLQQPQYSEGSLLI